MKYSYFILLIFCLGCFADTNGTSDPNILDSNNFPDKAERIQKLGQQIKSFSAIKDAEFELFNVNGFQNSRSPTIAGASSWDYKFVVKIEPSDLPKWRNGFRSFMSDGYDNTWMEKITSARSENWKTTSNPKFYERMDSDVVMIIYEEEGLVFKRVVAL